MKKFSQKEFSNEFSNFIHQIEKEQKERKIILKEFKHKNTSSYIPTKFKKVESNNDFSTNNNNLINSNIIKTNISSYDNNKSTKRNKEIISTCKRFSYCFPNSINISTNQNDLSNSLINFIKSNEIKREITSKLLPNIISNDKNMLNESSFKIKNNSKEALLKNKNVKRNIKFNLGQKPKMKYSCQNIKNVKYIDKDDKNVINTYKGRKFQKMKTVLHLNKQIDLLKTEAKISKEKGEENEKNNRRSKKGIQNQKLLYSKKFNNYIFKIYKAVEPKEGKKNKNNNKMPNLRYRNKSPKFCIKDYLNNFNPQKYIQNIKNKIKNSNIGNSKNIKNKLLDKSFDYIEFNVFKNIKFLKKKQDIFEKIIEKNKYILNKNKKELIRRTINEIILKMHFKHKKLIFKIYYETLLITQFINFQIHIKLTIIRHILAESEKDENIYFINLVKHLLYSNDQKDTIQYQLIKNIGEIVSPFIRRATTVDKFIEFNKKDIYYLHFCIKFQLLDGETILKTYDEKQQIKIYSTKYIKTSNIKINEENKSDIESEKEKDKFSSIEERLKKLARRSKRSKKKTFINRIKLTSSSKILNLNLTKNIINLRNTEIEDALKYKTSLNLQNLNELYKKKRSRLNDYDDSSDSFEYIKYRNKYTNKNLDLAINSYTNKNLNFDLNTFRSIRNDNDEIHQRDKILLYEHFIYYTHFSEFDKLIHWLKKSSKYMDLNYKFENGDTLLHLCVRHSVPHFIYKFLITHGINVNAQNNQGDTVLHLAAKYHKYKTIDFLIKMGASEYIYNKMRKMCWECL